MSISIFTPRSVAIAASCVAGSLLFGCASVPAPSATPAAPVVPTYSQAALPAAVQVPSGHRVGLETVGVGEITYQCNAQKDSAGALNGAFAWVFAGPDAKLIDRSGKVVGKYFGPPATWEHADGSKLTGVQLAVAPSSPGNIPLQLVKADPAVGAGAMRGVTHIQRVATVGGVAPKSACGIANAGAKQIVKYQADYIFYRSN